MDNSQIEIDDLLIGQAISEDSFGIFYSAHHQQLNQACLVFGLVSLPERPITKARLAQSLDHIKLIEHSSIAQVISFQECDPTQGQRLVQHAVEQGVSKTSKSAIEFLVVYELNPIADLYSQQDLTELQVRKMGEDLLELLSLLHKKRAYHHALSPKTLWLCDEGIKLTHSGLYSIYKRRGLSLKSSPNPDLDPALTHRQKYASPEELLGKLSTQGSDLFSVAVILYEYLVEPLPEPIIEAGEYKRTFKTDLPDAWQGFFNKSMATHIRERYPTADQMLKAFKALPDLDLSRDAKPAHQISVADLMENAPVDPELNEQEKPSTQIQKLSEADLIETVAMSPELIGTQESNLAQELELTETDLIETIAVQPELIDELSKEELNQKITESDAIVTVAMSPQTIDSLDKNESFDQTHSELDNDDHSNFDLNTQTELSDPNPEMQVIEKDDNQGLVKSLSPVDQSDSLEAQSMISDSESQDQVEGSDLEPEAIPQSKFPKTIGFFSGGEVSSEGFKSLRSQLSPEPIAKSTEQSSSLSSKKVETTPKSYDDMAFGIGGDLGMDDDFGFGQSQQDERTFIEFSDVDDQTVFEADQDQIVHESYKTEVGIMSSANNVVQQAAPKQVQSRPAQTMAFFSQGNDDFDAPNQLLTPDFLSDTGDNDPSRILPIPRATKKGAALNAPNVQSNFEIPPPLAQIQNPIPKEIEKPAAINLNRSLEPSQQSLGMQKSSIMGDVHDWPGQNDAQALYTPPTPTGVSNRDSRPVAKVRKGQSFFGKLISLIIPLVLVSVGAVGIYWAQVNWDLVMSMLASEAPERLSISTYPNNMQVVINNKPVKDRSPLIYNFTESYPNHHKLPVRFMWKRKIHNEQIDLSNGTTSVYFLAETMKNNKKKSRYRRRFSKKVVKFAKAYIETPGESLQVLLKDQPIGQTPLWIIAEQGKELALKLIGPGIEKEVKISPDNTLQSQISLPMAPKN